MRKLTLVFTKSKKFLPLFSWGIMFYTGKKYSHCAREFEAHEEIIYYQASEGRVNYENKKVFDEKHEIVERYEIIIQEEYYNKISKACLHDAGVVYGLKQNVGIFYVDIMKLFGKKVQNPWKKGKNCSELIFENALLEMFPELSKTHDKETIKPHHVERIILDKFKKDGEIWVAK